jgi:hypothetical protein
MGQGLHYIYYKCCFTLYISEHYIRSVEIYLLVNYDTPVPA